jgi:hypothetical protein
MLFSPTPQQNNLILELDGTPVHFANSLTVNFPGGWIGRGEPVAWPPYSPDLMPSDIFIGAI